MTQSAELATLGALAMALAGPVQFWSMGPLALRLEGLPLLRLDAISVTLATLVSFVGWIVVRYAGRYLDGEAREGRFHALTLAAVAAVLVLIQAASLPVLVVAFFATGQILRQLLLFYPDRPEARRAAAKFIRVWLGATSRWPLPWASCGTASERPRSPRWWLRPRSMPRPSWRWP
ncbi:hypothetical protein ACFSHQ_26715 [Gemmobacter lanyuensis]